MLFSLDPIWPFGCRNSRTRCCSQHYFMQFVPFFLWQFVIDFDGSIDGATTAAPGCMWSSRLAKRGGGVILGYLECCLPHLLSSFQDILQLLLGVQSSLHASSLFDFCTQFSFDEGKEGWKRDRGPNALQAC